MRRRRRWRGQKSEVGEQEGEEMFGMEAGKAAFPCFSWGLQLPPATPPNSNPLSAWRPWEVAKPGKWKKRSPASQARSLRRLREWQEKRDIRRGPDQVSRECSSTPLPPPMESRKVRLVEGEEVGGKLWKVKR